MLIQSPLFPGCASPNVRGVATLHLLALLWSLHCRLRLLSRGGQTVLSPRVVRSNSPPPLLAVDSPVTALPHNGKVRKPVHWHPVQTHAAPSSSSAAPSSHGVADEDDDMCADAASASTSTTAASGPNTSSTIGLPSGPRADMVLRLLRSVATLDCRFSLLAFSKGCIVLNQLMVELAADCHRQVAQRFVQSWTAQPSLGMSYGADADAAVQDVDNSMELELTEADSVQSTAATQSAAAQSNVSSGRGLWSLGAAQAVLWADVEKVYHVDGGNGDAPGAFVGHSHAMQILADMLRWRQHRHATQQALQFAKSGAVQSGLPTWLSTDDEKTASPLLQQGYAGRQYARTDSSWSSSAPLQADVDTDMPAYSSWSGSASARPFPVKGLSVRPRSVTSEDTALQQDTLNGLFQPDRKQELDTGWLRCPYTEGSCAVDLFVVGTPFQWQSKRHPFIVREKDMFVSSLLRRGAPESAVHVLSLFEDEKGSMDTHFRALWQLSGT